MSHPSSKPPKEDAVYESLFGGEWFSQRAIDRKLRQAFRLKPSAPHVVALAFDQFKFGRTAEGPIALDQEGGVFFVRDHFVAVSLNMKNRDTSFSEMLEAFDGIVPWKRLF